VSRHTGKPEEAVSRTVTEHGRIETCTILLLVLGPAQPKGNDKTQGSRRDGEDRRLNELLV